MNLRAGEQSEPDFVTLAGAPVMDFGDVAYGQSLALIEGLQVVRPDPPLIPADPQDALAVRSIAQTIACDIHPLNVPRVLKHLTGPMGLSDATRQDWYAHWVREGFAAVERQLGRHAHRGAFCVGDRPTLADICLVPQVLNARRFGVATGEFGRIETIYDRCLEEPAFRDATPPQD